MIPGEFQHLVKWPTQESDVSVDGMLRILGAEAQHVWLVKWAAIDSGAPVTSERLRQTEMIIGTVGLMAAIRALRDADPVKADAFVKDYWSMCDSGDAFGELLWDWTEQAGLDPALITLTQPASA